MTQPWPNLFIPGAPKAGTTSLHRYLDQHPEVAMSTTKEAHFFDHAWEATEDDPEAREQAIEDYLALFEHGGQATVRGESTPGYLHKPEVPGRIAETVPGVPRFVVLLRDPIERAHSDHDMLARTDREHRSFQQAIVEELALDDPHQGYHISRGLYDQHVARYRDTFGEEQVHVALFEDLKHDTLALLQGIAGFLGIDEDAMAQVGYDTVHNPGGRPRGPIARWLLTDERIHKAARLLLPKPVRVHLGDHVLLEHREREPVPHETREALIEVFEPSVANLEAMLGRDLPELRRSWGAGDQDH